MLKESAITMLISAKKGEISRIFEADLEGSHSSYLLTHFLETEDAFFLLVPCLFGLQLVKYNDDRE